MVIVAFMAELLATEGARLGQLLGTPIHHATALAVLLVALAVIGQALIAALVAMAGPTLRIPERGCRTARRAVPAALTITISTDDEYRPTPPTREHPPIQHRAPAENWARC
jgi:hypothetical protein